jgi:hypothetical protein
MERNARIRLTTAAILVLVFGSGALVGMAWDAGGQETLAETATATGGSQVDGQAESEEEPRRRRMIDRIDLNEEQRASVDGIIDKHRKQLGELNDEFRDAYYPRFYGVVENTRELIKNELTADQSAAYDSLLAAYDRERRSEDGDLPFRRRD